MYPFVVTIVYPVRTAASQAVKTGSNPVGDAKLKKALTVYDCKRLLFMDENSPLSGEFQKGEAYPHQKAALLCYKKDVLTFSVAKESNNG